MVLPLLALLLVMAVDFGRVYFGWVAIQNASRIAADHVSKGADAWPTPGSDPNRITHRENYIDLVIADLSAVNCFPADGSWDDADVPTPTFVHVPGTATAGNKDVGDHAVVSLTCGFGLITPLAESILGGPVTLGAESAFAINSKVTTELPPPPPPPPPPCTAPTASFTTVPGPTSGGRVNGTSPLGVAFTDTSTAPSSCPITSWSWNFDDGGGTSSLEDPSHSFTHSGGGNTDYDVVLTVTSAGGTDTADIRVRVTQ